MGLATSDLSCMENVCREGRLLSHGEEDGPLCQRRNSFGPRKKEIPFGVRAPAPAAGEVMGEFRVRDPSPPTAVQLLSCKT